ncbi:MAG: Fic family protein [Proteobacteria bacterium]|nr:Fic family protein [Pseudomonadota bacterium]MBU1716550.1 Fic family protein [Pseudomonadota bacterium]
MKDPEIHISFEILKLIAEIDQFKGQWHTMGQLVPAKLQTLIKISIVESIGSSLRLAGINCTDRQIGKLQSGLELTPDSLDRQTIKAIIGYQKVINLIHKSFLKITLLPNHINQLYSMIFTLPPGRAEALQPQKAAALKELIRWTNASLQDDKIHPLLLIVTFAMRFHDISPFKEGNGRMARVLTTLLLLRCGYIYTTYSSIEHVIEQHRDEYRALQKLSALTFNEKSRLTEWISFFLHALKEHKDTLTQKIDREKIMVSLPDSSKEIIKIISEQGQATISQIQIISKANRNTLKIRLRKLVKDKYLLQQGRGKGTRYTVGI